MPDPPARPEPPPDLTRPEPPPDHTRPGAALAASAPLIATKLRPPTTNASVVARPRLHARLDAALDESTRLAVVSAPPGYGKTVAVLGWLGDRGIPSAWLQLDPADDDPARFVRYLVAAIRTVRPSAGTATLALLGAGTTPDPDVLAATLIGEMALDDATFALVLDDYHVIRSEPVHALVRALVEHGPPFARLLVLTREDPPLPLPRLRAHGRLVEIRAEDLRHTADEAATYLARALGSPLDPEAVGRLIDRTEGWAAGLQLAAVWLRGREDAGTRIEAFHGSHRFVLDYLADEVLDRLDPELRAFLVRTSVADRFTTDLASELTGRTDADALLARAEQANLFLVPLDADRHWFRFHHLFAEYLRSLLPDDERRALRLAAAGYLERDGLVPEAIGQLLGAGDDERAADLVAREARPTFERGELSTLLAWTDALPPEPLLARPEVGSLRAWALFLAGRLPAARAAAERSLAALPGDARGSEAEGRLMAAAALTRTLTSGDVETAEPLARAALERLAGDPFFRAMGLLALAEVLLSTERLEEATRLLREALEAARASRQPVALVSVLYLLSIALNALGSRDEAERLCRAVIEELSDGPFRSSPIAGLARIALGTMRYEANDLVEARRELERGYAAALGFGFGRFLLGQGASVLAAVRRATGEGEAAADAVRSGTRNARSLEMASMLPQALAFEAQALLGRGDVEGAGRLADRLLADRGAIDRLIPRARIQVELAAARIRLAEGRPDDALALLAPTLDGYQAFHATAFRITARILEACACRALGRRDDGLATLGDAVALAAPGGYVRRLVEDAAPIADLLALVRPRAPAFVDEVMRGLGGAATAPAATPPDRHRLAPARGPARSARGADAAGPQGPQPAGRVPAFSPVPDVPGDALDEPLVEPLTPRELDVLRLMARGRSNAAIAAELVVSVTTAKWHVGNVLGKLGATNRTEALVRAQRLGLV